MIINMFNVSVFSANTNHDIRSGHPDRIWNISVLQEFKKLQSDNCQWKEDARMVFPYKTIQCTAGDHLASEFTASETQHHVYRGFWSEALWNKHRAGVIVLHQALLARLDAARPTHGDSEAVDVAELRYRATLAIQVMIHDIFASIPFSLGDILSYKKTSLPKSVGGYFLVWTLMVILRCPVASEDQKNLARAALVRIGRQFGLCYAVKSAQYYMRTAENAFLADSKMDIAHGCFNPDILA